MPEGAWIRLRGTAFDVDSTAFGGGDQVELSWRSALEVLRTLAPFQSSVGFEFDVDQTSEGRVAQFMRDVALVRGVAGTLTEPLSPAEIEARLRGMGWKWETHGLRPYQLEDLRRLLQLTNGANFSVPGAGKTTVTFALHLLTLGAADIFLVVAPRNAFSAWEEVVSECLSGDAAIPARAPFISLVGGEERISQSLAAGGGRFLISYDQLVRVDGLIEHLLAVRSVHLVLDESHRMKAGSYSRRGAVLLRIGHLATRRDILSGTPMPQRSLDLQSQLDFLWPGAGLGSRVGAGEPPRGVLGNLYVRTTKADLELEPRRRVGVPVDISEAHLAFYAVLRDDVRAQASRLRRGQSAIELIKARRSVMRLLQAAVNPELVANEFVGTVDASKSGLLDAVLAEGISNRVRAAADLADEMASAGRKVLVWTIFTSTLHQLTRLLAHHQPAVIYGAVGVGDEADDETRQGQIRRFRQDPECRVMVANPAAASEGMSLHMQCHDAIYVDRSYNATHFMQSVDRIHRLGLPAGTETTIFVLQNRLPKGVGSIDMSVARRLATKIRAMEQLLQDPDLHELALDEEDMDPSLDESIDMQDIDDLVAELENRAPPADEEAGIV